MTPKRTIAGRYELQEQIGGGGMAAVWRARDNRLDREVAVKLMRDELGESREFAARFTDEARRMARFSHPNIVSVHDYGIDGGRQFIVMELVRGRNLAQLIRQQGRLTPKRAAEIANEVAAALQAAHRYGVVHRDVKPANILVTPDGHVKLADLGIAQAADEAGHTTTGQTLGSVDYFSPEQARGEPAGPQTDVYALGVVLYEMLTGRRPFGGDSPAAIAISRLTTPPPDPRAVLPILPHALVLICMRALSLDPQRRYRSARGMRTALARWLSRSADDATAAQPTPVGPAAAPPPRRLEDSPVTAVQQREHAAVAPRVSPARAAGRPAGPEVRSASRRVWPIMAAVFLLLAVLGFAGQRILAGLSDVAEAPGIGLLASDTPAPTVEPTRTPKPATPSPEPAATPRERRTPEPTPVPATPQPTLAPTAEPATPIPAQVASADLSAPEAVTRFYALVTDARFDDAYALWSDRMRSTYPRQENLDERFDATAAIDVHRIEVVSQDADHAVVAIDFTETYEGGSWRRFQGSWELVRAGDRWILDAPHF
jgi:serine/threonine-protein kinase